MGKAISDIIDYVENPGKTDNGRLISSFQCDSLVEFQMIWLWT